MPRTLIDEGVLREVYHYRPRGTAKEHGDPVLLVTPLAAPALCFDLRRGCSLVEHFVDQGRPTYLVEYGEVSFANRTPRHGALGRRGGPEGDRGGQRARRRPSGAPGRLEPGRDLRAAHRGRPARPADRLADRRSALPSTSPRCRWSRRSGRSSVSPASAPGWSPHSYRLMGGAPKPLVKRAFQLASFNKLVTKPIAIAAKLDDADFLAQIEAVDRFTANMIAYPGRTFGQLSTASSRATSSPAAGSPWTTARSGSRTSACRCSPSAAPPTASPRSGACARSSTWCPGVRSCASRSSPAATSGCSPVRAARRHHLADPRRVDRRELLGGGGRADPAGGPEGRGEEGTATKKAPTKKTAAAKKAPAPEGAPAPPRSGPTRPGATARGPRGLPTERHPDSSAILRVIQADRPQTNRER